MLVKRCWCGAGNAYCAPLSGPCDGLGVVACFCGGDWCVCHNHGAIPCSGCAKCETADDDTDDTEPPPPLRK